ncbi:energy-coupling factor transport system ATP-binding protein [Ochrobactrum intermedium]|uniref:Energy-coupling factor transport system ATP-binding protein n=2 Tax=Brucella intermedia TaxID=94625 RepID=A0ABR6AUZ4_9HYPH|nr:ATP-binding cassette domain-containing protein [Brucella intermedia]MBA8853257.1 energy-coupling factor transport system ATP-binding protein [Brucella intermedia]MCO7738396.1 ATP-binding cassette domain-containing protein [Brucella intermedia]MDH0125985.1 ATP-binding cassette domain-containing protein [Brucella intermedia GD04153]WLF98480.1 ATP-binding cassette domain-containing protein [Brucella intermedia]
MLAIAEASLHIRDGERLLVCGAGGSGKTTLLNAASGIVPCLIAPHVFGGDVTLNGKPISSMSKDELFSTVGVVSQNVEDQLWDLSVEDLIAFPLENRGLAKDAVRRRIDDLLNELELNALRGRRVLTLSGGERRMVAMAAALAAEPKLLILDEPTTGLDPAARQRLVRVLKKLGVEIPALLIAEQDPASLQAVVTDVGLVKDGKLAPVVPLASIINDAGAWEDAGVLPPVAVRKRLAGGKADGQVLVSVSGIKTQLQRRDGQPVLENVNFQICAGEVVGLIGKNGAGKTTLFQSILGLQKIAAGSITIGGENADKWTAARRARLVAYLPQNMRRILFNMTVLEEVVFAITAATRAPKDDAITARATACLHKYGLSGNEETNPFALSSRQQALLGLACAEAAGASVAILDEPLLARDLNGRHMLELFLETALSENRAVMLISHDLELVDDVSSRVIILDNGHVTFDGDVDASWTSHAYGALGWPRPRVVETGEAA